MSAHNLVFVILMTSCFLLHPADAGLLSWVAGKAGKPGNQLPESVKGGSNASPAVASEPVTSNVATGQQPGSFSQTYSSPVYNVKIKKWTKGTDDCLENMVITQQEGGGRTIKGRCAQNTANTARVIRNSGDLLLIGDLDDDRCVFTSNRRELFYLQEGKWRRGEFSDSTQDRDLTSAEADGIRERIKNWQALFVKHDRERERIIALRGAEREISKDERSRITDGKQEARRIHRETVDKIRQSRIEERNEHTLKKKNIYKRMRTEGMENLKNLLIEEDERHRKRLMELEEMMDNEDKNYEQALQENDEKLSEEERRSDQELRRLYALEDEEEKKMVQEVEEKIKQGW